MYSKERRPSGGGNRQGGGFNRNSNQRYGQQPKPKHAVLPPGFSLYYFAIICPTEINLMVQEMKDHMDQRYGCRAAKKSPAHLTIIPPFRAEDDIEYALHDFAEAYSFGILPFQIELKGYGQFGDRVLFVDVVPNELLNGLEKDCMEEFSAKFPGIIFGMKPDFNPHVTIATRDIPLGKLHEARRHFENHHPVNTAFEGKAIHLLKLTDGFWRTITN